jgi:uncharacterized protein with HEPN domain
MLGRGRGNPVNHPGTRVLSAAYRAPWGGYHSNRIVHGYWDIDVETLVTTAIDDLPLMIQQLEHAIGTQAGDEAAGPTA